MLIINKTPDERGAHGSQRGGFSVAPDGWALVPPDLEEKAWSLLPFIDLTFDEGGSLTDVAQGTIPEPETPDLDALAAEARDKRNALLLASDWSQVLDAPIDAATREAYRAYRQALRDIPEQPGFPVTIEWPVEPVSVKAAPDPVDDAVDELLGGVTE